MRAKFTIADGLIQFSDNKPGGHATLFLNGESLAFHPESSSFDDKKKNYTWGFRLFRALADGDRLIFATAEVEIVGAVEGGKVRVAVAKIGSNVARDEWGKPTRTIA